MYYLTQNDRFIIALSVNEGITEQEAIQVLKEHEWDYMEATVTVRIQKTA